MKNYLLSKYSILVFLYSIFLAFLYWEKLFVTYLSPLNFFIYFLSFILICENYRRTNFNKNIILVFKTFYFYTSTILPISLLFRFAKVKGITFFSYTYFDIFLSFLLLVVTFFLLLYSFHSYLKSEKNLLLISIGLSFLFVLLYYQKFLILPDSVSIYKDWAVYVRKNYIVKLIIISSFLIFWYRSFQKYFVISEYLNAIIFLFMLSNILEGLQYIAFQLKLEIFVYSQYLALSFNILFMVFWYLRLVYLNKDISKKNEKYLANFQYLGALVSKPKHSRWQRMVARLPINKVSLVVILIVGTIFFLYFVRFINLYLMLNTIFIVVLTFFAIFFSFSSIKRNWNQQMGFIFKGRKKKA